MKDETVTIKMAEMRVVEDEVIMKTTLGSCVGIILHDPRRRIGGLAHVMLPRKSRNDAAGAKYADTAIPMLLGRLEQRGCAKSSLKAYLVGGARMFAFALNGLGAIGDNNVQVSREILQGLNIPIVFEDVGGTAGRTVSFDNANGKMSVRMLTLPGRKQE